MFLSSKDFFFLSGTRAQGRLDIKVRTLPFKGRISKAGCQVRKRSLLVQAAKKDGVVYLVPQESEQEQMVHEAKESSLAPGNKTP